MKHHLKFSLIIIHLWLFFVCILQNALRHYQIEWSIDESQFFLNSEKHKKWMTPINQDVIFGTLMQTLQPARKCCSVMVMRGCSFFPLFLDSLACSPQPTVVVRGCSFFPLFWDSLACSPQPTVVVWVVHFSLLFKIPWPSLPGRAVVRGCSLI